MNIRFLRPVPLTFCALLIGAHICGAADAPKPTVAEARAAFAKADKALNDDYAFAKKKLSKPLFDELREEQRLWIKFREDLALAPSYSGVSEDPDVAKQSAEYFAGLTEITNERIAWVARWIAGDVFPSLTGIWRDAAGGWMQVYEQGDKLHFAISVVRGRQANLGEIAGTAEWNDPIGWFSDRGREPDKTEVSNLAFISRQRTIEVIGAKTRDYGGKNVAFDGVYIRVGRLDAAGITRLSKAAAEGKVPEN